MCRYTVKSSLVAFFFIDIAENPGDYVLAKIMGGQAHPEREVTVSYASQIQILVDKQLILK